VTSPYLTAGTKSQTFGSYADKWLKDYARVECKTSTADGYQGVLSSISGLASVEPRVRSDQPRRHQGNDQRARIAKELSRNTVRNALCVIRGIFNEAIEAGIVEVNPAARIGRSRGPLRRQRSRNFLDAG